MHKDQDYDSAKTVLFRIIVWRYMCFLCKAVTIFLYWDPGPIDEYDMVYLPGQFQCYFVGGSYWPIGHIV